MSRFLSAERRRRISARPQWAMVIGFAATILLGALLLWLPVSQAGSRRLTPLDALFTATSATCVTGLTVVDIGTQLSGFGQFVVLSLVQLGGLGIMTFGTFLLVITGRRLSVHHESVLLTSLGSDETPAMRSLLLRTVLFTLLIEGAGAALLTGCHLRAGFTISRALYYGIFHSVSAFCNAGFALFPGNASLVSLSADTTYLLTVAALVVAGGLGFLVLHNLSIFKFWQRNRKTRGRLTMHSHMVLSATLLLLLLGWSAFMALEWRASLAGLDRADKVVNALFQSAITRTAGFNAVPMETLEAPARLLSMALMFVGGGPGSTAGGIKITTLVVLLLTIVAMIRGRRATLYRRRTIPEAVVREAIVIFLLAVFFVAGAKGAQQLTEAPPAGAGGLEQLVEAVSAFGTVGLSLGATAGLSAAGRVIIVAAMFVGRLGPLTVALTVGSTDMSERLTYPEEEVVVG